VSDLATGGAAAGGIAVNPTRAVRALVGAALHPDGPATVHDLVRILAQVSGCDGAVLWEAPDGRCAPAGLSIVSLWVDLPSSCPVVEAEVEADPVTAFAFGTRSLAVPDDVAGRAAALFGLDVMGALPIDYLDGCRGALTLLGPEPLAAVFDTVVEVVDVLPELCSTVRERQTLALVNACDTILHDADVECREGPVPRPQLAELLSDVCRILALGLHAAEVSIFLEEPGQSAGRYTLFAHSDGTRALEPCDPPRDRTCIAVDPADRTGFDPTAGGAPFMEVRLLSGTHINGLVRCLGTEGPPHHFTTSDLALLRPVAAQLSRYWRTWQHRWELSEENESWRRLAAGMTSLNRLVAEELARTPADGGQERRVADLAVRIMRDVVPESAAAVAYRTGRLAGSTSLTAVAHTGNGLAAGPSRLAKETVRGHRQLRRVPDGGAGWMICTPIAVGERVFGVLETSGPAAVTPANSEQVNEIIGDQLGLYRHLHDTLGRLHDARHRLELALRTEAEAMEDLKHQLVSPLRTAASRTESVLRSGRFDGRVEAQLKAVRGLCRKASRVAMSAGVFATLSRGQQPVCKPERIGVDDLVRLLIAAADDAQVLSDPRRGIHFEVDRESVRRMGRRLVNVDTSFLQQCVGNVLDNAAKYGYESTRVNISAEIGPTDLTLAVASTGIPLHPADLPLVVQRNWRGDTARSTTGEGSGLGLWIVDHLARAMGGRVLIDACADLTTVRLVLPLA
jgi:signal transduction histidine kinase